MTHEVLEKILLEQLKESLDKLNRDLDKVDKTLDKYKLNRGENNQKKKWWRELKVGKISKLRKL
jgi:hypothetical protein